MNTTSKIRISVLLSVLLTLSFVLFSGMSCSKKKSTNPKVLPAAPTLLDVIATCGPEILLSWTDNANNETGFKIERSTGGAFAQLATVAADTTAYIDTSVAPSTKYLYRVTAYTSDGNSNFTNTDSATTGSGVSGAPAKVVALSGKWYKGTMSSSTITPSLLFAVQDGSNNPVPGETIRFSQTQGNGVLSADSVAVDNSCTASLGYTFNGSLGHAVIEATAGAGVDTEVVNLRASVLIPGAEMQGQYLVYGDDFRTVIRLNGTPASVDTDPVYCLNYANYESALGVVFVIDDAGNCNSHADSAEAVVGVIVNSVYTGKTLNNIGIGSSIAAVRAAFGTADSVFTDPTPPPAVVIKYDALGLTFYGNTTDTTIFEIHLFPTAPMAPVPVLSSRKESALPQSVSHRYHLLR